MWADNKQPLESSLLSILSEATSGLTGHNFLIELPKKISSILGMRFCFIAECANEDKTRLRTIVFVEGEKVLDNVEYNTMDSGC
jgi:adenylate cyclase